MNIKELNGNALKRALKCKTACFRWHNKNKSGGNFGINIRELNGVDYELTGIYGCDGTVGDLRFGVIYQSNPRLMALSFEQLIEIILKAVSV